MVFSEKALALALFITPLGWIALFRVICSAVPGQEPPTLPVAAGGVNPQQIEHEFEDRMLRVAPLLPGPVPVADASDLDSHCG